MTNTENNQKKLSKSNFKKMTFDMLFRINL